MTTRQIELELLTLPLLERFRLIQRLINTLGAGESPAEPTQTNDQLTVEQAADILNVSQPYLINLLKQGEIPHIHNNNEYRINVLSLIQYKQEIDRKRLDTLRELAHQAEELDMGY